MVLTAKDSKCNNNEKCCHDCEARSKEMINLEPTSNVDLTISIKETFMIFVNFFASLSDLDGDGVVDSGGDGGDDGVMVLMMVLMMMLMVVVYGQQVRS